MPDTVAGLFRARSEVDLALRNLKEAGFGPDRVSVATPRIGRRGHYGVKVLIGIAAGTLIGALVGAVVRGMAPGLHPLLPGNVLVTFLLAAVAGAAIGGVALWSACPRPATERSTTSRRSSPADSSSLTGSGLAKAWKIMRASGVMEAAPVEAPLRPESG
jgi:hypothetical protein